MIKCKKVLSWDDNTTKEQSKVSSSIKKGLSWVDKTTRTIKLSSNIKKFFPGLIRPQKSWHSRLFRMLTLWWEEHPRPINQSITIISDITQLWNEYSGQTKKISYLGDKETETKRENFKKDQPVFILVFKLRVAKYCQSSISHALPPLCKSYYWQRENNLGQPSLKKTLQEAHIYA